MENSIGLVVIKVYRYRKKIYLTTLTIGLKASPLSYRGRIGGLEISQNQPKVLSSLFGIIFFSRSLASNKEKLLLFRIE